MTQSLQPAALTASLVQQRTLGQRRARESSRSSSDGNKQNKYSNRNDAIGFAAMSGLAVLGLLLLQTGAFGFDIFRGVSLNHQEITEEAILKVTAQACRSLALAEGKDFIFPTLTVESVVAACEASKSSKSFRKTIKLIQKRNRRVDFRFFFDPRYHFDNENFAEGRQIITDGLAAVKASNQRENFEAAREQLGEICHPLQDFYSHSNWVEMGNTLPNPNLIRPGTNIGNIAAVTRATCRNCNGDDCRDNILEDILQGKILTSGYFDFVPVLSTKPAGKCSHGDKHDETSQIEPRGGINKDTLTSSHGHLHMQAARLAIAATSELLEDIRGAAGDRPFLQMMGISKGKALCFVIDTTGSMRDDIATVRTLTSSIINSKVGTEDEPSVYILVPFNDPDFGPLTRTTDPNVFRNAINSLSASGGGDFPEMSLSGLQLALTGAPPNSEIFLFTDATAKDQHLKSTVIALIERTKSVVNFMLTGILGLRRRRQDDNNQQQQQQNRMVRTDAQLYRDLAQVSGGLAIEVRKSQLPEATSIITQSSSSSLVTLLQAARTPGKAENFTFTVDESVRNLTVYITGSSVIFTLISPSGVSQESTNTTGSLITASQSVGNFKTLQLNTQAGLWEIKMVSTNPYSLKVIGESPIDFLFDFLEASQGLFGGFDVVDNRPRAGVNGSMIVTITGSDSAMVTEVILVESSGSGEVNGKVEAQGGGDFLARFDRVPAQDFVVLVKGQSSNASSRASTVPFQRQFPTNIKASAVTVTTPDSISVLEPGTQLSVPFSVTTSGAGGTFTIRVTNDQGFSLTFPSSLVLATGGIANGTVNITAPANTPSGTDVTLTIEAEASGGADTNYVVQRFTVLKKVTDFTPPMCQLLSLQSNCSDICSLSMWKLSVQVTDGANGTGVDRVSLRQGNGTLSTSLAAGNETMNTSLAAGNGTMNTSLAAGNENITLVSYNSSCCSPDVELLVVDRVGNVASCSYSVRKTATNSTQATTTNSPQPPTAAQSPTAAPVVSLSTRADQSLLLCFSITILGLNLPF
ncbi:von Willebrand factor A domain-containing protein 7-like isoform X2 [Sebastes fasciatus]|uniref:von Willebrand factor A domain-containing protein 7-like isoform X2 n=1 Tax=Sebastes fasciatus TaxID=394691 RepID=UPI003D9E06C5